MEKSDVHSAAEMQPARGSASTNERSSLLNAQFWPKWHFGDPNQRFRTFIESRQAATQQFIESLVFHDEVIIPTTDFMSLGVLLYLFGEKHVRTLIDSGAIKFARIKGCIAYVGNGGGLQSFSIREPKGSARTVFGSMDQALEALLDGLPGQFERHNLIRSVCDHTIELALSVEFPTLRERTISDLQFSSMLRGHPNCTASEFDRLPGISQKAVRIYGGSDSGGEADDVITEVLKLADANLEIHAAQCLGATAIATGNPLGHALRRNDEKPQFSHDHWKRWGVLTEVAGIPDIGAKILQERNRFAKLLKLRQSIAGVSFRKWFNSIEVIDPQDVCKAYVALLKDEHLSSSPPVRVIRFLATSALGLLGGDVSGAAAGAADGFVLDRVLQRNSAKVFLQKLEQLK